MTYHWCLSLPPFLSLFEINKNKQKNANQEIILNLCSHYLGYVCFLLNIKDVKLMEVTFYKFLQCHFPSFVPSLEITFMNLVFSCPYFQSMYMNFIENTYVATKFYTNSILYRNPPTICSFHLTVPTSLIFTEVWLKWTVLKI